MAFAVCPLHLTALTLAMSTFVVPRSMTNDPLRHSLESVHELWLEPPGHAAIYARSIGAPQVEGMINRSPS